MAPVNNPYAKKHNTSSVSPSKQTSQTPQNPYKRNRTSSSNNNAKKSKIIDENPAAASMPNVTVTAASFSQAFGDTFEESSLPSANDSTFFSTNKDSHSVAQPQQQQQQQQQQVKTEANVLDLKGINERDHHVLLQPHVLYVSTKQRGNHVLQYIRNVPCGFSKMVPDYIMSGTTCALFLSIKYHQLYPNYIHRRIGELGKDFALRIMLVMVDVDDNAGALRFLNKLAVTHDFTLILAWSELEAARYLEAYKALDGKDSSSIQKRESTNFQDQNADFMTACKPVNKTDANNLLNHFSTIHAVAAASADELALCEGLGPIKVKKLYEALHKPFSKLKAKQRQKERALKQEDETKKASDKKLPEDQDDGKV